MRIRVVSEFFRLCDVECIVVIEFELLRGAWNFTGYVTSDTGAVIDIFRGECTDKCTGGHHYSHNWTETVRLALEAGCDVEAVEKATTKAASTIIRGLVLGCIETKFCKKILNKFKVCVVKLSPRATQYTPLHCSTTTFLLKWY